MKLKQYNKALVPLVTAAAAVIVQWLSTGHFSLTAEFFSAAYGVAGALVVGLTRNFPFSKVEAIKKAVHVFGLALLAVFVQWTETRHFTISQEFVTSLLGVVTAFLVFYVPNFGPLINAVGSLATTGTVAAPASADAPTARGSLAAPRTPRK